MLQGPNFPSVAVDDNSYGSQAWTNPGNALVSDGVFATVNTGASSTNSHYLNVTGFGFSVPSNATITGVYVEIQRESAAGAVNDNQVLLVKGGTAQTTQNRASLAAWGTTLAWQAYGSSTDLWGLSLAPADVNGSGFGVALSVNGNDTASVDAIRVTVYYSEPKDLIPLARAYQNLQGATSTTTTDALVGGLVTSVSDAIQQYCRRDFVLTSYDELYNGNGDRRLLLRQYPIQSVQSVRYRPTTVLKITNTDPTNVQARVSVTSTGLTLVRVNAGTKTTDTSVTFAGNVTLSAVASAVNALGNGWSAQVVGDSTNYGSWPSGDLYWPPTFGDGTSGQGALQCVASSWAELKMHTYELAGFQWDSRGWLLRAIPYTDPELLHPEDLVWPNGINNFRVQYTSGYSTIPEAVQEACAEWVAELYYLALRDPAWTGHVDSSGQVINVQLPPNRQPPPRVAALLAPYRRHTIATGQG